MTALLIAALVAAGWTLAGLAVALVLGPKLRRNDEALVVHMRRVELERVRVPAGAGR